MQQGIHIADYSYLLHNKALFHVRNAQLMKGQLIVLLGVNGSGKTTLIRAIPGIQKEGKGVIAVEGKAMQAYTSLEMAKLVSVQFTGRQGIPGAFEVKSLIATGRYPHSGSFGFGTEKDDQMVMDSAKWMGITDLLAREVDTLSDGEFQKVMLARALAQDTPYILLDEPFSFLDYPAKLDLMLKLKELAKSGKGILFSSHELDLVLPHATEVWIFCKNREGGSDVKSFNIHAPELKAHLHSEFGFEGW
jgi:iron complex transport system ATP-binding protein